MRQSLRRADAVLEVVEFWSEVVLIMVGVGFLTLLLMTCLPIMLGMLWQYLTGGW